jgi:hypothetical protein
MSTLGLVLVIVLVVVLLGGGLGPWRSGPYWGTGPYGPSAIVVILVVVLILVLLGKI